MQLKQLEQLSGFSYPTVAGSLKKIESFLRRHSDRRVELNSFPRDEWFRLIANSDNIRVPLGFFANRPRSVEDLIGRLTEKSVKDVAVSGIIGAHHYLPGIDLIGIPRLDLTVHNWSIRKVEDYVRKLDPGLKRAAAGEISQVVVHNLYRPESFFIKKEDYFIADEVECLMDLHEARLETQALELLDHLKRESKR